MAETLYGTHESDTQNVMSERVQALASSVYQEFERMLKRYDEDVVKELMPLVVGILENLDQAYQEKQETDVELELLRDDNEQLLTQYEREKQLRKSSEQKCLEIEDVVDGERKDFQVKTESLESVVRMLELKGKNAQDHISRLEDKEVEMKKEYTKLHDRYTDLFKTHMDYMERTKIMMSGDRICESGVSPRTRGGFQMPHLRPINTSIYQSNDSPTTPDKSFPESSGDGKNPTLNDSNISLKNELEDIADTVQTAEKEQNTENVDVTSQSTGTNSKPSDNTRTDTVDDKSQASQDTKVENETSQVRNENKDNNDTLPEKFSSDITDKEEEKKVEIQINDTPADVSFEEDSFGDMINSPDVENSSSDCGPSAENKRLSGNSSSIFEEFSAHGMDAIVDVDDGVDITGMSKEVENLILENTELLATKNALNIVKDDLISKVDELTSEQEILKEEITSLQTQREKLRGRVSELEGEVKKVKEDLDKMKEKQAANPEGEEGGEGEIPMAQRKRFTRVEMARVLMERNQYKERLMELQEAVRWTEMIRASKEHPDVVPANKKKGSIWNFFSGLGFSATSSASSSASNSGNNINTSSSTPAAQTKSNIGRTTII